MNTIKSIQIDSILDLKKKIKSCKELNINYELVGTLVEYTIDFSFLENEGIIFAEARNIEDISYLVQYYNFDNKKLKYKTLEISLDIDRKEKEFQEFIKSKDKYFKLKDTKLNLRLEES